MNYIDEIFDRADLQQIREFLLYGVECKKPSDKSYLQRLLDAETPAIDRIKKKFPDEKDYEEITNAVYDYSSTVENVYMEIGMQCGTILTMQLLSSLAKQR